jgi:zinc transport system substrate-binding protein
MIFRLIFITLLFITNAFASPNIVVSIKPIHSIVSHLTQGVTTPTLLLENQQSAHYFHLKPSQLYLLDKADLVVSIHPNFETGLSKALNSIDTSKQFIVNRQVSNHHSWLDISHMQNFAKLLTDKLIKIDNSNSATYQNNLTQVDQKLEQLKRNIDQQLSKVKTTPIATFSNTLEYFIESNHLQKSTTVTRSHGDRLSIQKILKAKQAMQAKKTKCLLSSIEIPAKRINVLTEGLDVNTASIDIMGYQIDKGAVHYFDLMQNITNKVEQCLQ